MEGGFKKAEHVMPQAFGKFEQNFTLRGIVCDDCNHYFGNVLERILGRDTFEGHARFRHGVKNQEAFNPLRSKRVTFKITEGQFTGAHAYTAFVEKVGHIQVFLMPQVGFFLDSDDRYEYFLVTDIPTPDVLRERGFNGTDPRSIVSVGIDSQVVRRVLAEKGITFNIRGEIPPDTSRKDLGVEMTLTIDDIVCRAVAKIAFNYMAYWQHAAFALHPAFDVIRTFIRYGDQPGYPLVQVADEAILGDEPIEGSRRLGNLITTGIAMDGVSIFAQVSLLNQLTYRVALARDFPGAIPPDFVRGHLFSLGNHRILELEAREKDGKGGIGQ